MFLQRDTFSRDYYLPYLQGTSLLAVVRRSFICGFIVGRKHRLLIDAGRDRLTRMNNRTHGLNQIASDRHHWRQIDRIIHRPRAARQRRSLSFQTVGGDMSPRCRITFKTVGHYVTPSFQAAAGIEIGLTSLGNEIIQSHY